MVHGCNNGVLNAVDVANGAIKGNRPRLFAGPSFAQGTDIFGIALIICRQAYRHPCKAGKEMLVVVIFSFVDMVERSDGFEGNVCHICFHLLLIHPDYSVDKVRKHRRWQKCQGMLVGDGCHFAAGFVHERHIVALLTTAPIPCHEQCHRRHAHNAAAALAIVLHLSALKQTLACR